MQRPLGGLVVHQVRLLEGSLEPGAHLQASVDEQWRLGACQAHSGTHIVHAALREILGPTALQSGSYNRPGYLRLDFGWNDQVSAERVAELEQASNEALRADLEVSAEVMPLQQARAAGALALFGERYPDMVRVVEIGGPWSRELCGGTHVERSSQIGTVVLMPISSVGAGNRRVEAFVGLEGFRHLTRERDLVNRLTDILKTPHDDVVGRVQDMVERLRTAEKQLEAVRVQQLLSSAGDLAAGARAVGDVHVVTTRVPEGAGAAQVRTLALDVRGRLPVRPTGRRRGRGVDGRQAGRGRHRQRRGPRPWTVGERPGEGRRRRARWQRWRSRRRRPGRRGAAVRRRCRHPDRRGVGRGRTGRRERLGAVVRRGLTPVPEGSELPWSPARSTTPWTVP